MLPSGDGQPLGMVDRLTPPGTVPAEVAAHVRAPASGSSPVSTAMITSQGYTGLEETLEASRVSARHLLSVATPHVDYQALCTAPTQVRL